MGERMSNILEEWKVLCSGNVRDRLGEDTQQLGRTKDARSKG